jgi:hypothetical protein
MASFNLDVSVVALLHDGSSRVIEALEGRPVRVDGYTVGAPWMTSNPPHRGEMHPEGDELLYLISGQIEVIIEEGDDVLERPELARMHEGRALGDAAEHGTVNICEPSHLIHVTPDQATVTGRSRLRQSIEEHRSVSDGEVVDQTKRAKPVPASSGSTQAGKARTAPSYWWHLFDDRVDPVDAASAGRQR